MLTKLVPNPTTNKMGSKTGLVLQFILLFFSIIQSESILYPLESETRELKSLDGIWKFQLSPSLSPEMGFDYKWFSNKTAWSNRDNSNGGKDTKIIGESRSKSSS